MSIAPRAALLYFRTFEVHSASTQIALDDSGKGTALNKSSEYFYRETQIGRYTGYISLGTCNMQMKDITGMHRLAAFGSNAKSHACGDKESILAILLQIYFHIANIKLISN
jgi:hypothetical protein